MRLALQGKAGIIIGSDLHGDIVLAAYEPVAILNYGIVAKIDLDEIRAPFYKTIFIVLIITFLLITAGSIIFFKLTNPLIKVLKNSKKRLLALTTTTPTFIYEINKDGMITFANRTYEGLTRAEVEGTRLDSWYPDNLKEKINSIIYLAIDSQQEQYIDYEIPNLEGDFLSYTVQASPILGVEGEPTVVWTSTNITNIKKTEEKLAFQASLLEQVDSAIITIDFNNTILTWNKYAENMYQWSSKEAVGEDIISLLAPEESLEYTHVNFDQLNREGHWEGDYKVKKKDGTEIPAHITNTKLYDTKRNHIGFIGISTDISVRVKQEAELMAANRLLEEMEQIANIGAWEIDLSNQKVTLSKGAQKIHGIDYPISIGEGISFYKPDAQEVLTVAYDHLLETGTSYSLDLEFTSTQGKNITVHLMGSPIYTKGKITHVSGTIQDISDRKILEMELASYQKDLELKVEQRSKALEEEIRERIEIEQQLQAKDEDWISLVKNLPDVYYRTDMDGIITRISPACLEEIGYQPEEMLGQPMIDFYANPKDRQKIVDEIVAGGGKATQVQAEMVNKAGENIWISTNAIVRLDNEGKPFCVEGIARNITETKRFEKQLEESTQAANEANEAKSRFLANMSHELRTPMHSVLSYSSKGMRKIELPKEKLLHYFEQIHQSGNGLMELINNLLDISKMEAHKMGYDFNKTDLLGLNQKVCDEFTSLLSDKNVTLRQLPCHCSTEIELDTTRISQVIRNLISNAIKFSSVKGEITIQISNTQLSEGGKALLFQIQDQGLGLDKSELEEIFEDFQQGRRTQSGAGGTGLGLFICKQIIQAHNGKIWAESGPDGIGSTFSFILPLHQKNK